MSLAVANQYAKALLGAVTSAESGVNAESALEQLSAFDQTLKDSNELRTTLLSPAVDIKQKKAVVSRLAQMLGMDPLLRNFLFVVIQKRRLELLSLVREAYRARLDESVGIVRAQVTSSQELGVQQRSEIEAQLERISGKQVRCQYAVDSTLLGGVTAKLGSMVYDGSVRGQLDALRRKLAAGA